MTLRTDPGAPDQLHRCVHVCVCVCVCVSLFLVLPLCAVFVSLCFVFGLSLSLSLFRVCLAFVERMESSVPPHLLRVCRVLEFFFVEIPPEAPFVLLIPGLLGFLRMVSVISLTERSVSCTWWILA